MASVLSITPFSAPLAFSVALAGYVYPVFVFEAIARKCSKAWTSDVVAKMGSVSAGLGFAHWFLRMVPLSRRLVEMSALGLELPISEFLILVGIISSYFPVSPFPFLKDGYLRVRVNTEAAVEIFVPGNRDRTYDVRLISSVTYTKLALLFTVHFFVEGFIIGSTTYSAVKMYLSTLSCQLMIAFFLSTMVLRTGFGTLKTTKVAFLFASSVPLGIFIGLATAKDALGWFSYVTLATTLSLVSGCYFQLLFDEVVLPEVTMENNKSNIYLVFWGIVLYAVCEYPIYFL